MKKDLRKIKIFKDEDIDESYNNIEPSTKDNYIGVEIECFGKPSHLEMIQYLYHSNLDQYIAIKTDGSIEPRLTAQLGYEFTICAPQKQIYKVITKFCALLKFLKFEVNSSCGLHVHIDMRNRDVNKCFKKLVHAQSLLYAINPRSRTDNDFCQPTENNDLNDYKKFEYDRKGINGHAYDKHETIEVRIHTGTLNSNKINNWIKLLLKIINHKIVSRDSSFNIINKVIKFDKQLHDYIIERCNKFKNKSFLK